MKLTKSFMAASVLAVSVLPLAAVAQEGPYTPRGSDAGTALSQAEINDLIAQARNSGVATSGSTDVRYLGANQTAVETVQCCENVEERVETRSEVKESETFFDAVTARTVIQPIERTLIQPVEVRVPQGRNETETEAMRFEENVLPVRVERDPVPQVVVNNIPQETTETREEVTETFYDVVGRRVITQPVERTTVVPVQRRITRPRIETVQAEPRFETRTLTAQVQNDPVPQTTETVEPQVTEVVQEQRTETPVPYVAQRDIVQPLTRTTIQPVEIQRLVGRTETTTAQTQFVEEVLPVQINTEPAPGVTEEIVPQISERTVFEVEDVYIDQITRNIIQPVVITEVQPITRRLVRAQSETVTAPTQFETQTLPGRVEDARIPETVVNFIPQVTEDFREERSETTFEAVTQRDVIQPIVRTLVQPVEIRRPRIQTENVSAPTRYETVRANLVVLNVGGGCNCN